MLDYGHNTLQWLFKTLLSDAYTYNAPRSSLVTGHDRVAMSSALGLRELALYVQVTSAPTIVNPRRLATPCEARFSQEVL